MRRPYGGAWGTRRWGTALNAGAPVFYAAAEAMLLEDIKYQESHVFVPLT